MKALYSILISLLLALSSFTAAAQEVACNNGRDDDGDGFVDCYDTDCKDDAACEDFFMNDGADCEASITEAPAFKLKLGWASANETASSYSRPTVGDIDKDGVPEVVIANHQTNRLNILRGNDGSLQQSILLSYTPLDEAAIADVDNDGYAEIFQSGILYRRVNGVNTATSYIETFKFNAGTGLYNSVRRTQVQQTANIIIGVANFKEEDGKNQIYYYNEIVDANTGVRLVRGTGNWNTEVAMMPVAVDVLPDNACADCNGLELIIGGTIYAVNLGNGTQDSGSLTAVKSMADAGTPFYVRLNDWGRNYSSTSIADYNQDGYLDVIASGATGSTTGPTTLFYWDVQNNTVRTYTDPLNDWKRGTGRLNVADIDGNGQLNVTYVSGSFLYALDENFDRFWRKGITEATSGFTGCTVFDFNGDGAYETVYRDEAKLYIVDGRDGTSYREIPCKSRTSTDYPVVVDVNGDGATEICVSCNTDDNVVVDPENNNERRYGQIRMYQSDGENWVPARKIWNQHSYFNVNINDNLSVPVEVQKHNQLFSGEGCDRGPHRPLNTFLNQSPYLDINGCPVYGAPDFVVDENSFQINQPTCPEKDFTVSFTVRNEGDVAVNGRVPFTAYNGDPRQAGTVALGTTWLEVNNLRPGDELTITDAVINGPGNEFHLYINFNDGGLKPPPLVFDEDMPNGGILECYYDRNLLNKQVVPDKIPVVIEVVQPDLSCNGSAGIGQGEMRAYVPEGGVENDTDYEFIWYNSSDAEIGRGAVIGNLFGGQLYKVVATHIDAGCTTSAEERTMDMENAVITYNIFNRQPQTQCEPFQNGRMEMQVLLNGVPDDASRYHIRWFTNQDTVAWGPVFDKVIGGTTYFVKITSKDHTICSIGPEIIDGVTAETQTPRLVISDLVHATCQGSDQSKVVVVEETGMPVDYRWYRGTQVNSFNFLSQYNNQNQVDGLASGWYTVVATNPTTRCVGQVSFEIQNKVAYPNIVPTIAPNTVCENTNAALANGSISVVVSSGSTVISEPASGYSFAWYRGHSTNSDDAIIGANSTEITGQVGGAYTLVVTNNDLGCSEFAYYTIPHVPGEFTITSIGTEPNEICDVNVAGTYTGALRVEELNLNGSAIDLTQNSADYTFVWRDAAGVALSASQASGPVAFNLNGGDYTVEVTNTLTGCRATQAVRLTNQLVKPNFRLVTRQQTSCDINQPNGRVQIMQGTALLNLAEYNTEWYTGSTVAGTPLANNTNELNGRAAGTYTARVTSKETGCFQDRTVTVTENVRLPVVTLSSSSINCATGNTGSITATVDQGVPPATDYTFTWYFENGSGNWEEVNTGEGLNVLNQNANGSELTTGRYKVVVVGNSSQNANRTYCSALETTQILQRVPAFTIDFSENQITACNSAGTGSLTASVAGSSASTQYKYTWYRGVPSNLNATFYSRPNFNHYVSNGELSLVQAEQEGNTSVYTTSQAGPYTVVVEHNGCFEWSFFNLSAIDAPKILAVVKEDNRSCSSPDGVAGIELGLPTGLTYSDYNYYLFNDRVNPTQDDVNNNLYIASLIAPTVGPGQLPTFNNLPAGTYSVLVVITSTTGNACVSSKVFSIDQLAQSPEFEDIIITNNSNCATPTDDNGSIKVIVTPKDAIATSYRYRLLDAGGNEVDAIDLTATEHTFTQLSAQTYSVEVIALPTNCVVSSSNPLEIKDEPLKAKVTATNAVSTHCADPHNGSLRVEEVLNGASTDLNDYSFAYYTEATYTADPQNAVPDVFPQAGDAHGTVSGLRPGNYVVVATQIANAANGGYLCPSDPEYATVGLEEEPLVATMTPLANNTNCSGDASYNDGSITVTLTAPQSAPAAGFTYQWYRVASNGTVTPEGPAITSNLLTNSMNNLAGGTFRVVVTNNTTGCTTQTEATINNVPNPPVIENGFLEAEDQLLCDADGQVWVRELRWNGTLTTDFSQYTFSWYYEGDLTNPLTDLAGNPITSAVLELDQVNPTHLPNYPNVAGAYHVVATRNNTAPGGSGCSSAYASARVEHNPPAIDILVNADDSRAQTSCTGGIANGKLVVSASGNPAEGGDAFTYLWSDGQVGEEAVGLVAGSYTVTVTNTRTGCTSSATYTVDHEPYQPQIESIKQDLTVCPGGTYQADGAIQVTLDDIKADHPMQLRLVVGQYTDASYPASADRGTVAPGGQFTNLEAGIYTVFAEEVTPSLNCAISYQHITIDEFSSDNYPQASIEVISTANLCRPYKYTDPNTGNIISGNTGQLRATVNGRVSGYTFVWYQATETELTASANPEADFIYQRGATATRLLAADYTLRVTDNQTGCYTDMPAVVPTNYPLIPAPSLNSLPQTTCLGLPNGVILASINGQTEGYRFAYRMEGEEYVTPPNDNNYPDPALWQGPELSNQFAGVYYVKALHLESGCESEESRVEVGLQQSTPTFTLNVVPARCLNQSGGIGLGVATMLSSTVVDTEWYGPNGQLLQQGGFTLQAPAGMGYSVVGFNAGRCDFVQSFDIGTEVAPYNLVTPNDDGKNDHFIIECIEDFPLNTVKIFNRTGTVVFEMENYNATDRVFTGQGNRGIYLTGNKLPDGTYFYIIEKHQTGHKPLSGYLELKR